MATNVDPTLKRVVEDGYNRIAERYAAWTGDTLRGPRARYVALLFERLREGADVLELGCATGVLTTRALSTRFAMTGVDLSARQVELATRNVPKATFVRADMTKLTHTPATFAAVIAFYSITHVPRTEHPALLRAIATWLRPGGVFVASLGASDDPGGVEEDWLGTPMYFSGYDAATNRRLVADAGLRLLSADELTEDEDEDGTPVTFLWVVATKPGAESGLAV